MNPFRKKNKATRVSTEDSDDDDDVDVFVAEERENQRIKHAPDRPPTPTNTDTNYRQQMDNQIRRETRKPSFNSEEREEAEDLRLEIDEEEEEEKSAKLSHNSKGIIQNKQQKQKELEEKQGQEEQQEEEEEDLQLEVETPDLDLRKTALNRTLSPDRGSTNNTISNNNNNNDNNIKNMNTKNTRLVSPATVVTSSSPSSSSSSFSAERSTTGNIKSPAPKTTAATTNGNAGNEKSGEENNKKNKEKKKKTSMKSSSSVNNIKTSPANSSRETRQEEIESEPANSQNMNDSITPSGAQSIKNNDANALLVNLSSLHPSLLKMDLDNVGLEEDEEVEIYTIADAKKEREEAKKRKKQIEQQRKREQTMAAKKSKQAGNSAAGTGSAAVLSKKAGIVPLEIEMGEEDFHTDSLEKNKRISETGEGPSHPSFAVSFFWISLLIIVALLLIFLLVFIIHLLQSNQQDSENPTIACAGLAYANYTSTQLLSCFNSLVNVNELVPHFNQFTAEPTLAGTVGSHEAALYTNKTFASASLHSRIHEYRVLLHYPLSRQVKQVTGPSAVHTVWSASLAEDAIEEDLQSNNAEAIATYNAYSPSGNVTGQLVYVNYGRREDFELLSGLHWNLEGKIAIARYGQNFRGLKVMMAQAYKMAGMLIYSDPADDGAARGGAGVYPSGPFRPETGVQRGSTQFLSIFAGDPLTPNNTRLFDLERNLSPVLPRIPVQPLSAADARYLMSLLTGISSEDRYDGRNFSSWQGGYNFIYHVGVGTRPKPIYVNLDLLMKFAEDTPIYNVVATIPGIEEDEREILLGNHRDAWIYGALDPHIGSAMLLQLGNIFGQMVSKYGWQPHRTIRLCSWDAEEFGLIGSTEFVEEFEDHLKKSAAVYLNVDVAVTGEQLAVAATPSLTAVLKRVIQTIPSLGDDPRTSLYEANWNPQAVNPLGSGSDFTPFFQHLAIPSVDLRFISVPSTYGVYHSVYDDRNYANKFHPLNDQNGPADRLLRLWGALALTFASEPVLPFNYVDYADQLSLYQKNVEKILDPTYPISVPDFNLTALQEKIDRFHSVAAALVTVVTKVNADVTGQDWAASSNSLDALNAAMMVVERNFTSPAGHAFPFREIAWYRHVVFAPSLYGGYSSVQFPGLVDALAGEINTPITSTNADLATAELQILLDCLDAAIEQMNTAITEGNAVLKG